MQFWELILQFPGAFNYKNSMKKISILLILLMSLMSSAQNLNLSKQLIKNYEKSFIDKDFSSMEKLISDKFTIGVYQRPSTDMMLKSILNKYYPLDSLQFLDEEKAGGIKTIKVKYFFKGQKATISNVVVNNDNKIQYVDLFDKLYRIDRYVPSKKIASIPFEVINGSIVLKIKLNDSDEEFKMLFDTGADGMALNETAASKATIKNVENRSTGVVGAKVNVKFSSRNTIHVGGIAIKNQNLVVFSKVRGGFDGLFGGNFLSKYITSVNFDTKRIELFTFGMFDYEVGGSILPISYATQLPIVNATLNFNNHKRFEGEFVFDTGADYNVIVFGPSVEKNNLEDGFPVAYQATNYSFGHQTGIKIGDVTSIDFDNSSLKNVPIALQEFQEDNKDWSSHDGSIGISVISKFNFIVNVLEKQIYLKPNKSFNKPFDFVLKGVKFGFTNTDELIVKEFIQGTKAKQLGVSLGDSVATINDYSSAELLNTDKVEDLKNSKEKEYIIIITEEHSSKRIKL